MKKTIAVLLSALMLLSVGVTFASAEDSGVKVNVTITDKDGKLALAAEEITVSDTDGDDKLTVTDVLYTAHELFYEGGAAAGYATKTTEYGLALDKLWGNANYPNFGYTINNVPVATDLKAEVKADDYVVAYSITDSKTFKDRFSYFDVFRKDLGDEGFVELTLSKIDYDENWNNIVLPVAGAELTVNGEPTGVFTGEDGKAVYAFDGNGEYIVSAKAPSRSIIVPPVCRVKVSCYESVATPDQPIETVIPTVTVSDAPTQTVTEAPAADPTDPATKDSSTKDSSTKDSSSSTKDSTAKTGDNTHLWLWILISGLCLCGVIGSAVIYKKHYANK